MITNFITMNGHGLFVWLSFAITIIFCSILYLKTRKTLKKYEKEFAMELEKLSVKDKKELLKKSKVAKQILTSYNQTI